MNELISRLGIRYPIFQAPMAGVSTPQLAAAVIEAGGLGSVAVGHLDAEQARRAIEEVRRLTVGPFNVNVFCHRPADRDPLKEQKWLSELTPIFNQLQSSAPAELREIYSSYVVDRRMQSVLLDTRPAVVSFHFGLPEVRHIRALQANGSFIVATATSSDEARVAEEAGVDAIVAQGMEAGGHRGMFDPHTVDEELPTLELTSRIADNTELPVIAAGGVMDAADVVAAIEAGASAVQVGTAFLLCPEVSIDPGYRSVILEAADRGTTITRAISGRPARSIANEFTRFGESIASPEEIPSYPVAYDAGKALKVAAAAAGNHEFGAHWAGVGVTKCEPIPAAQVVSRLLARMSL